MEKRSLRPFHRLMALLLCLSLLAPAYVVPAYAAEDTVAAEETTKLRKEIKERALVILVSSLVLLASQYVLSYTLVNNGIYDTLTRALTLGMSSFTAMLIGNAIWIWWKHRK